jgi:hypothetical protein
MAVPPMAFCRAARRRPARPIASNSDFGGNWANRDKRRRDCPRFDALDREGKQAASFADWIRQFLPVCG